MRRKEEEEVKKRVDDDIEMSIERAPINSHSPQLRLVFRSWPLRIVRKAIKNSERLMFAFDVCEIESLNEGIDVDVWEKKCDRFFDEMPIVWAMPSSFFFVGPNHLFFQWAQPEFPNIDREHDSIEIGRFSLRLAL